MIEPLSNLFSELPEGRPDELVEVLARGESVRIERIVSTGQRSPEGFWYDQPEHEWVIVLKGEAELRFEGERQPIALQPGDYLNIPAHTKHRVESTASTGATVWLAVFYDESGKIARRAANSDRS